MLAASRSGVKEPMHGPWPGRFRLMQYFMATSLVAFAGFGIALFFLERSETLFFDETQRDQNAFFGYAQMELVREQKAAARANLLMEHEAGHITLTTIAANALWGPRFAPLVAKAQQIPIDHCRSLKEGRQECFAEVGRRIQALAGFAAVNDAVHVLMRKSAVFKIKVYDLRGLTVYSSELAQIGEDKAENKGWISAVQGRPASELVHRDRFSAFEGEVENRDLIQSYIPVHAPGGTAVSGVFEIYSDVTPLIKQIDALSARIENVARENHKMIEAASAEKQHKVESNAQRHFAILAALFILLYVAVLVLVRNGQRMLDEQQRAREQAALREQQWHREKMAALATMAANASHEIGNPLAIISGMAEDIARARAAGEPIGEQPQAILEQAARIAEMTRRITQFASARGETPEPVDVNQMIRDVADFLGFDDRYRDTRIELSLAAQLPACLGIPDHMNEVLMSLIQAHAEAGIETAAGCRIVVRTEPRDTQVTIRIECECAASGAPCALAGSDWRLESARRRMEGMGGRLAFTGRSTEILLPCLSPQAAPA